MTRNFDGLDSRVARAKRTASRLAAIAEVMPQVRARCLREENVYGWDEAIALLFRAADGLTAVDVAAGLGSSISSVFVAFGRCPFLRAAEKDRGERTWHLVEGDALREVEARMTRERAENGRAAIDRHLVDPYRHKGGGVKPLRYGQALRALFVDGRERSSREIGLVVVGVAGEEIPASLMRASLSRYPEVVEPATGDLWRRVPSHAELRAEVERLRGVVRSMGGEP